MSNESSGEEEEVGLLPETLTDEPHPQRRWQSSFWAIASIFLITTIASGAFGFYMGSLVPANKTCAQRYSTWSEFLLMERPGTNADKV